VLRRAPTSGADCWDALYRDPPDHKSHPGTRCTIDHPVALPMTESKMAFPYETGPPAGTARLGP
jgi:hypothetical protein